MHNRNGGRDAVSGILWRLDSSTDSQILSRRRPVVLGLLFQIHLHTAQFNSEALSNIIPKSCDWSRVN